jgi:hypothetical protein
VAFRWAVVESCNLTDRIGDIGAWCVCGQVQQHPDNRRVAPSFVVRLAVRVNTKSELGDRCQIGITVRHAGSIDDLLDQSILSQSNSFVSRILDKLDTKEVGERSFSGELWVTFRQICGQRL